MWLFRLAHSPPLAACMGSLRGSQWPIKWILHLLSFLHLGLSGQMLMCEPLQRSVWSLLSLVHSHILIPARISSPGWFHMHTFERKLEMSQSLQIFAVFYLQVPFFLLQSCIDCSLFLFFLRLQVFHLLPRCWGHRQLLGECLPYWWGLLCCNRNQLHH